MVAKKSLMEKAMDAVKKVTAKPVAKKTPTKKINSSGLKEFTN